MSLVLAAVERFDGSRQCFEAIVGWLDGGGAAVLTHGEVEDQLDRRGRELLCRMFQEHLDGRAVREERAGAVVDADGVAHGAVEARTWPEAWRRPSPLSPKCRW